MSALLRRILDGQQRVTATFQRPDGRTLHVRSATQAEPDQRAIYDALGARPARRRRSEDDHLIDPFPRFARVC